MRLASRRSLFRIAFVGALLGAGAWRFVPRPTSWPLVTYVDGPAPADADAVIVFLHGKGGSLARGEQLVHALRESGLPANVSIVLVEGPYHTWFGHQWGDNESQQASSRRRIRARLRELLGDRGPTRDKVIIAGFSQGAGVAIDTAIEEPRIGAVASFSPCASYLRGELPKSDLRVLLAHGKEDPVCPVEESRSLARALDDAHHAARYVEFDGSHTIAMEAVRALASFTTL